MDTWNEDFVEPTEDDRTARRIVALAIALINARQPITTDRIRREFYQNLLDEAFRKAFRRDRVRLSASGIVVKRSDLPTGETAWMIDEADSFVRDNPLSPEDALALDLLLLPLASDPSFPYANDLRLALAKIDRSFDASRPDPVPNEVRTRNRQVSQVEQCMAHRHAARITYTRADGSVTKRTIVPYGLFSLRSTTYLVASKLQGDSIEDPHIYNLDRMGHVRELGGASYPIPPDFDVHDYIRLPFQIGPTQYTASFKIPDNRIAEVRTLVGDRGDWIQREYDCIMRANVSDETIAASWSVAQGVIPLEPESLVRAWKGCVLAFCGKEQ